MRRQRHRRNTRHKAHHDGRHNTPQRSPPEASKERFHKRVALLGEVVIRPRAAYPARQRHAPLHNCRNRQHREQKTRIVEHPRIPQKHHRGGKTEGVQVHRATAHSRRELHQREHHRRTHHRGREPHHSGIEPYHHNRHHTAHQLTATQSREWHQQQVDHHKQKAYMQTRHRQQMRSARAHITAPQLRREMTSLAHTHSRYHRPNRGR